MLHEFDFDPQDDGPSLEMPASEESEQPLVAKDIELSVSDDLLTSSAMALCLDRSASAPRPVLYSAHTKRERPACLQCYQAKAKCSGDR